MGTLDCDLLVIGSGAGGLSAAGTNPVAEGIACELANNLPGTQSTIFSPPGKSFASRRRLPMAKVRPAMTGVVVRSISPSASALWLAGCAAPAPRDQTALREARPASILVLPPLNTTSDMTRGFSSATQSRTSEIL